MGTELVPFEGQELDLASRYALAKSNPESSTALRTARLRRDQVRAFLTFAGVPVEEITAQDIEAWRADMEGRGLAASTQYQRVSLVSQFFKWAVAQGIVRSSPVPSGDWRSAFRPKPYSSETVKAMNPEEVRRFFEAIPKDTVAGLRLRAMCLTMLHTGMRAAEVSGIVWRNTSLSGAQGVVRAKVKGGTWVSFELTSEAAAAIQEYLTASGRHPGPDDGLFASIPRLKKGGKANQPMTPFYLWCGVKRVAKKVGLPWVNVHSFRHSFAQLYHNSGASLPEVQGGLGHSSGLTTRIYIGSLAPRSSKAGRAVQAAIWG